VAIWRTIEGEPVAVGDVALTTVTRRFLVRWRGGGILWHAPAEVVARTGGRTTSIRIVDVTRRVQIALLSAGLAAAALALVSGRRRIQRR
jgi:hypothetical protein